MQLFPLDENGDVLRRMVESGDNLAVARDIDFVIVAPDNASAKKLAEASRSWGFPVEIEHSRVVPALPWEVRVVHNMIPTHEGITDFEQRLEAEAALVGARNDGWGCLQQA